MGGGQSNTRRPAKKDKADDVENTEATPPEQTNKYQVASSDSTTTAATSDAEAKKDSEPAEAKIDTGNEEAKTTAIETKTTEKEVGKEDGVQEDTIEEATIEQKEYKKPITIIHFNDVYNVESRDIEPVGGAARFCAKVKSLYTENCTPLVLFSGDIFNPSIMSTVTKGVHMVPVLKALNVNTCCFGNHDFDHGLEHLEQLAADTGMPWLLSNVYDVKTKKPLAGGIIERVIEWQGMKIGLMGLVEKEWLETLTTIEMDEVIFEDYVVVAKRILEGWKTYNPVDLVVALTHMRVNNDTRLMEEVPEIDLVLGGHDHHYEVKQVGETTFCKSGTDFREFTMLTINFTRTHGRPNVSHKRVQITSDITPDPGLEKSLSKYIDEMGAKMKMKIGETAVALDGRFTTIRREESNLGNLVVDVMREAIRADVVLLNSGTLRIDEIVRPGKIRMQELVGILPMLDHVVMLEMSGETLIAALQNGVSKWPALEGRFLQVSGVQFMFEAFKDDDGKNVTRVLPETVKVGGEPVDLKRMYKVGTKDYLMHGKDGFTMFPKCTVLIGPDMEIVIPTLVRNYFSARHNEETDTYEPITLEKSGRIICINKIGFQNIK